MENEENIRLTIKQQKFADLYIETGNATQSYIDAGYKATTKKVADANARKLLEKHSTKQYIEKRMNDLQKETVASQQEVLEYLTSVMRGEVKDQFGLDASLQDRTKCAELLGKRYGAFIDRKEIKAPVSIKFIEDIDE